MYIQQSFALTWYLSESPIVKFDIYSLKYFVLTGYEEISFTE